MILCGCRPAAQNWSLRCTRILVADLPRSGACCHLFSGMPMEKYAQGPVVAALACTGHFRGTSGLPPTTDCRTTVLAFAPSVSGFPRFRSLAGLSAQGGRCEGFSDACRPQTCRRPWSRPAPRASFRPDRAPALLRARRRMARFKAGKQDGVKASRTSTRRRSAPTVPCCQTMRGDSPCSAQHRAQPCIRSPLWGRNHDAAMRIDGEAPSWWTQSSQRH